MSGVGKSTVVPALVELGYRAIDADDGRCVTAANGEGSGTRAESSRCS